jgi:hypothetical protein
VAVKELDHGAFRASKRRPGVDKAAIIAGISDDYQGKAPDIGAYESGEEPWKAGHDFDDPPNPTYAPCQTPLRNRIRNGSFELFRFAPLAEDDTLHPWRKTHALAARLVRGKGGIQTHPDERLSRIGHSVELGGPAHDGIEQRISGLEPNTRYTLGAFVRTRDAREIRIGVKDFGGKDVEKPVRSQTWLHAWLSFTTGPHATSATVTLVKPGPGRAYADDIGLVPALQVKPPSKP